MRIWNMCTQAFYLPCSKSYLSWITSIFLKQHNQVTAWTQPRSRDMVSAALLVPPEWEMIISILNYLSKNLWNLHWLWWLSTIFETLVGIIRPSVVACLIATTSWSNICGPESTNALSIYPSLTFPHTSKVNCHWVWARRSIKICLVQHILPLVI